MSDGVLCGGEDDWLKSLLKEYPGTSPGELTDRILRESEAKHQAEDDSTVLAVRLDRGKEPG